MARQVLKGGISGLWVTKQVDTNAAWTAAVQTELTNALALCAYPITRGISIRTKASTLTTADGVYVDTLFNNAKTYADAHSTKLSIRYMCGVHCPAYLFTGLGCRYWWSSKVAQGCVATASSTTVTGGGKFAAGDVGAGIAIPGAGTAGADHLTTIAGFTNVNSITLTDAAVATKNPATVSWGGSKVPHVCDIDGTPNAVFLLWLDGLVHHFRDWCHTNGVSLMHNSWPAKLYAEPFGNENHIGPVTGYDATGNNWRAGMSAVLDTVLAYADTNVTMEFASSGTYNLIPGGISGALAHGASLFGNVRSPLYYIQENGIEFGVNQYHGLGNANTSRGGQMYIGGDFTAAQWDDVFDNFCINDQLDTLEVYSNFFGGSSSFTGPGSTQLKARAEAYFPTLIDPPIANYKARHRLVKGQANRRASRW